MAIRVSNFSFQALLNPTTFERFVNDPIAFNQEPFRRKIRVSNFTFQSLLTTIGPVTKVVTDVIPFDETVIVINFAGDRQVVNDPIAFQQVLFSPSFPQVTDVLNFQQEARSSITNGVVVDDLNVRDEVDFCFGAKWTPYVITDEITFLQTAGQGRPGIASNAITFSQTVAQIAGLVGNGNFIDFQQTVSVGKGLTAESVLNFQSTITTQSAFLRVVTDPNIVQQSSTFYIDNGCNQKRYTPFVGEGSAESPPAPRMVFDASLVLESVISGNKVVLRNPETDDNDRLGFSRINRETRGGELNVFSDPTWAEVNTLIFTITAMPDGEGSCPNMMENLLSFMQTTLGEEIFLHDWTGTSWRGVITTPNEAATEDGDGFWTVTFEFEGIEQAGSVPQNNLALGQTLAFKADWKRTVSQAIAFDQTVTAGGTIRLSVSDPIGFVQTVSGTHEKVILFDNLSAGSAGVTLNGTAPNIGTGTWRSHTEIKDNGTMANPVDAGAYFAFTPVDGTIYELTMLAAFVDTYSNGDNSVFGFFEAKSSSSSATGSAANGDLNPTCAKAVHLMRKTAAGAVLNSYRLGSDSDGAADTKQWTDSSLRTSVDDILDLRIKLDTRPATWTAQWFAKALLSGSYTEVGPVTPVLSENIGAVGWSSDSNLQDTELTTSITLKELKPI